MTISRLATSTTANVINTPWSKLSGGTVTTYTDSNGWLMEVHTFTATGTLTVTSAGMADVLVVGGGMNGYANRGGAGAGARQRLLMLSAGSLTATVGSNASWSFNGGNSSLGSVLVAKGASGDYSLGAGGAGVVPPTDGYGGGGSEGTAVGSTGGAGLVSTITGSSVEYGKGGNTSGSAAAANTGGGGSGATAGAYGIVVVATRIG